VVLGSVLGFVALWIQLGISDALGRSRGES
jgi:hypothetical protein